MEKEIDGFINELLPPQNPGQQAGERSDSISEDLPEEVRAKLEEAKDAGIFSDEELKAMYTQEQLRKIRYWGRIAGRGPKDVGFLSEAQIEALCEYRDSIVRHMPFYGVINCMFRLGYAYAKHGEPEGTNET